MCVESKTQQNLDAWQMCQAYDAQSEWNILARSDPFTPEMAGSEAASNMEAVMFTDGTPALMSNT